MEHIKIEQNSNVEVVDSNIIHKLAEEAQDCDASSNMTGNLQTDKAFRSDVSYLTTKFPGLTINVTGDYYKSFVDPAANEFFAKCPAGDGEGILETEFAKLINTWGYDQKYRLCNNNNYFGGNSEVDESNVPLASIIKKIVYFPEIVDFPVNNSGITFGGYYLPIFRFMNSLKEARCPRQASYVAFAFEGNGSNVELLDMSDADNYIGTELACSDGDNYFPKLKKIVLAPSVTYIRHGGLNGCGSPEGMDIFAYTTDLSTAPSDVSGWALKELPHVATLWVQDSVYNDWLQHKQVLNNNYVIVKKFSEYTGDDLVQKWLEPSND